MRMLAVLVRRYGERQDDGSLVVRVTEHDLANLTPNLELQSTYSPMMMEWRLRLRSADDRPVVHAGRSIRCPKCGRTSWHPEDVRNRFCGVCGFHDQLLALPAPQRRLTTSA